MLYDPSLEAQTLLSILTSEYGYEFFDAHEMALEYLKSKNPNGVSK